MPYIRASDAERDRAIARLSEHYQADRLTAGELEDRSGRALRARTGTQLAACSPTSLSPRFALRAPSGTVMQIRVSTIQLFAGFDIQSANGCHQPDERERPCPAMDRTTG